MRPTRLVVAALLPLFGCRALPVPGRQTPYLLEQGRLEIVETRHGHAAVDLLDFPDGAPEFCERIRGWMERTMELAGAQNLKSAHSLCRHRGDAVCRFEGYWGGAAD